MPNLQVNQAFNLIALPFILSGFVPFFHIICCYYLFYFLA